MRRATLFEHAPELPYAAPRDVKDVAGYKGRGRVYCPECAPLSLYWKDATHPLPRGWVALSHRTARQLRREGSPAQCSRCEDPLR